MSPAPAPPSSAAVQRQRPPRPGVCGVVGLLGLLALLALLALGLSRAGAGEAIDAGLPPFETVNNLPRHTGAYAVPALVWTPVPELRDVRAVFPHPTRPGAALVTTGTGTWATDDAGANWRELPALRETAVRAVTDVAFRPAYPDTLVVASATRGVWLSRDAGASAAPLGTAATGLLADAVSTVCFYPADPTHRTVLAAHGPAHGGLSRSADLGQTWSALYPEYHIQRLLPGRPGARGLFALAAPATDPERTDLYYTPSVGQFWRDLLTDILSTDAAVASNTGDLYLATLDTGLYRIDRAGTRSQPLTPDAARWDSVELTWGAHADEERLYAYDPRREGLVLAPVPFQSPRPSGRGLPGGPFVRAGARLRANAGGSRFYAVVNGALYTGRNQAAFRVDEVSVVPDTLTVAATLFSDGLWQRFDADLQAFSRAPAAGRAAAALVEQLDTFRKAVSADRIQIVARVVSPPDGTAPASVTVDLSRLGQTPRTAMLDDGQHGDGAAADGVYGVALAMGRDVLKRRDGDWRCGAPGRLALTVSALAPDQALAGAVGVLGLYLLPDTLTLFSEWEGISLQEPQGEVRLESLRDRALAATGERCLRLSVGPGAWTAPLGLGYDAWNITGFYALGFSIRAGERTGGTVRVHLQDVPAYALPTLTPGLDLVAEELVAGGCIPDDRYVRVIVPLARLIDPAGPFLTEYLGGVVFSGNSGAASTLYLDDLRVYLTPEEATADSAGGRTP